jgi:hypothetical protein
VPSEGDRPESRDSFGLSANKDSRTGAVIVIRHRSTFRGGSGQRLI